MARSSYAKEEMDNYSRETFLDLFRSYQASVVTMPMLSY